MRRIPRSHPVSFSILESGAQHVAGSVVGTGHFAVSIAGLYHHHGPNRGGSTMSFSACSRVSPLAPRILEHQLLRIALCRGLRLAGSIYLGLAYVGKTELRGPVRAIFSGLPMGMISASDSAVALVAGTQCSLLFPPRGGMMRFEIFGRCGLDLFR